MEAAMTEAEMGETVGTDMVHTDKCSRGIKVATKYH